MPNRYVREGIIDSERINKLSWQAEVFYRRLLNRVDDFGRFTANPELLRASLFPLQLYKVQAADIGKMLLECEQSDLVSTWKGEDGKPYLALHKWEKGRAKFSKYPHPPTHVNKRLQMFADVPDPDPDPDPDPEIKAKKESGRRPSLADVKTHCEMSGYPLSEGEAFWNHFEASGWIDKNGHPILKWGPKLASWIANARAKPAEAKHNGAVHSRPLSPLDIRTIIGAKEKKADALKAKHSSLTAQGDTWSNPKAFEEWRTIRKEIRQLNDRLSNLA